MWTESLPVNCVNLVNISATMPEVSNFSFGLLFMVRPVGPVNINVDSTSI